MPKTGWCLITPVAWGWLALEDRNERPALRRREFAPKRGREFGHKAILLRFRQRVDHIESLILPIEFDEIGCDFAPVGLMLDVVFEEALVERDDVFEIEEPAFDFERLLF